jgi:hypothetical protein
VRDRLRVISMPFKRFDLLADFAGFLGDLAVTQPKHVAGVLLSQRWLFLARSAALPQLADWHRSSRMDSLANNAVVVV